MLIKLLYIFTYPISRVLDRILGIHEKTRMEKKDIIGLVELSEVNKNEKQHGEDIVNYIQIYLFIFFGSPKD